MGSDVMIETARNPKCPKVSVYIFLKFISNKLDKRNTSLTQYYSIFFKALNKRSNAPFKDSSAGIQCLSLLPSKYI